MKTIQRLNVYQSLNVYDYETLSPVSVEMSTANVGWYVSSGTETLHITGEEYFAKSHYVMKINVVNKNPITIRLDFDETNSPFETEDIGQNFVFTCVLKCTQGSPDVAAKLYNSNGPDIDSNIRTLTGGSWDAVRSNVMNLNSLDYEQDSYGISITVSNHSPNADPLTGQGFSTIYISTPNLVNDSAWANNPVIQNMRPYLPGLYESYDSQETDPTWPFFRLVDVLTDAIADTMFYYSDWFEHSSSELPADFDKTDLSTRSRLVNYKYVREENIPWLSQFAGNKPVKYVGSNNYQPANLSEFIEWQLYPAGYGRGSGTQSAIRRAAQFFLTGEKIVVISQRYDAGSGPNPWNIRITTRGSETPDLDFRNSVLVATTAPISLTGYPTIDGITVVDGDRVLVKNMTNESENGIYDVSSGAWVRSSDFNQSTEMSYGATFYVKSGDQNGDRSYTLNSFVANVGSSPIQFSEYAGSPSILALTEKAKPMGYKIYHSVVADFTLTLGDSTFGVLGSATL